MHVEAKRNLEFIGGEQDRHLQQLWAETKIGDILPLGKRRKRSRKASWKHTSECKGFGEQSSQPRTRWWL